MSELETVDRRVDRVSAVRRSLPAERVGLDRTAGRTLAAPDDGRFRPGRAASSTRVTLVDGVVLTRTPLDEGDRIEVVPRGMVA